MTLTFIIYKSNELTAFKVIIMKENFIYIITNKNNTVLYTGVTSNLPARIIQHKSKDGRGFSNRYNLYKLVYFEVYSHIDEAIKREKQIKAGSRQKKIDLINSLNPSWTDLFDQFSF